MLSYLAEHPEGVTTGEVSRFLRKSSYTAYYLLNTLCQERFAHRGPRGRYGLIDPYPWRTGPVRPPESLSLDVLHDALDELNLATGCRAYLALYDGRVLMVEAVRGRQGQLGVTGVGEEIRAEAHALAVGKVILAHLPESALRSYIQFVGLRRFTPHTITGPAEFKTELARVRRASLALDREEYQESIYCIAAPVTAVDKGRQLLASLGIVVPSGRFKAQGSRLVKMVHEVASRIDTVSQPGAHRAGAGPGSEDRVEATSTGTASPGAVRGGAVDIGFER